MSRRICAERPVPLFHFTELSSTNAMAARLIKCGAPFPFCVVAERQTMGHGRRQRPWSSVTGNLHMTVALRLPFADADLSILPFISALALAEPWLPAHDIRFKWPNDLMVADRKVGGIWIGVENLGGWVARIGMGLNLAAVPPKTKVAGALGLERDLDAVAQGVFGHLWELCQAVAHGLGPALLTRWQERAYGLGGPVSVTLDHGQKLDGIFLGLAADGAMRLWNADKECLIVQGDVEVISGRGPTTSIE